MKKLLFLAVALIMSVCGAWAGNITSLEEVEEGAKYTLQCPRGYLTVTTDLTKLVNHEVGGRTYSPDDECFQFQFVKSGSDYYLYNVGANGYSQADGTIVADMASAAPVYLRANGTGTAQPYWDADHNLNFNGVKALDICGWVAGDIGNQFAISKIEVLTYTISVTGVSEGGGVIVNDTPYTNGQQVEISSAAVGALATVAVDGYFPATISVDGTTINVTYTALPFQYAASFDAIQHWYSLNIHYNNKHYVYYKSDANPNVQANVTTAEVAPEYAWGFVGNPTDGFTIYNKAAGKDLALYSADNNTSAYLAATGSTFKASITGWTAAQADNGFCLKVDGQQYINFQGDQLKHWSSNDAGSTFLASELTFEEEPVGPIAPVDVTKNYYLFDTGINQYVVMPTSTGSSAYVAPSTTEKSAVKFVAVEGGYAIQDVATGNYIGINSWNAVGSTTAQAWEVAAVEGGITIKNISDTYTGKYFGGQTGKTKFYNNNDNPIVFTLEEATGEEEPDTREALTAVYIKNGEGKYFAVGGQGDNINLLDEGQTWNIAPVATHANAYTLENAEIDATKRFVNSGSYGYTSRGEDYNAKNVYFYELTDAATGTCTLVAQPALGKTYAMVIQNVNESYAGYYVIYSGLAKDKMDRGDVIKLDVTELPTTLTITEAMSSSNGAITPAKAFWTLTDKAEEPEPEPIFVEGTPITAIEEFTDGATVYLQDAKFSKYIVNATTVADAADVNCYITLEQVADNTFRLKLSNGKYLSYDPETIGNDAPAYDEEDQAKATVYTVVAQGTYWRFQFAFAEDATAEQTYNIVGGSAPIITWNKPDGAVRRNFTVYKVPSEEPEPTFPEEGKAYKFQEISSEMFLNVIPDSEDNKKDVVLKKAPQALYFTAVEGGYTITTEDGLYVGGFSNGWNMSSQVPQTWVIEEVEGGYAFRTLESVGGAAMYIGFDTVENEGAAAFRNKDYSANHGIFAITDFSAPILSAKEKLEAAVAAAGEVKTEGLPSDLVEALATAVESGNQALTNTESTDADYDKARLAIEKAISNIKNYTPQSDEEMFADLTAVLAAADDILTLNKVEGGLDDQNEYVISSTVAGAVGYKPLEDVYNIGEACAITQYIIELAENDAATLALICATQGITIRDLTVEIQALIDAYNEAEVLLPEKDKTYIIRLAPDQYSWALTLDETEAGEKALNTVSYSEISGSLSKDNAWTCTGQEEYVIVNSQLEPESLGMRLRFTSASQPELYLGWKTVTTSSTEWNTYWQISGKNAAVYGYLTMQAYDGANHYKYLTTNALTGALNHSDTPFWVENSEFSSSYIFEEVDPASLDEGTVGVGTVIRNNASGQRYNLQGQRIGKNQRGINLVGGKKLLIK